MHAYGMSVLGYICVDTCVWYDIGITSSIASCPVCKQGSSWTPAHWLTGQPATSRDLPVSTSSCPDSPRWSNPSPCLCSRLLVDWAVPQGPGYVLIKMGRGGMQEGHTPGSGRDFKEPVACSNVVTVLRLHIPFYFTQISFSSFQ